MAMTYYTPKASNPDTGAAFDYRALAQLRQGVQAGQGDDAEQQEIAHQFEALFLHMMLRRMREASPQDGLFDSDQTRMVQSLADEQLATQLAKPGIGLAQALLDQIQAQQGRAAPSRADKALPVKAARPRIEALKQRAETTQAAQTTKAAPIAANQGGTGRAQQFASRMAQAAQHVAARIGIPAPLVLAQAALESGWGAREIRHPDGRPSHNLFGIKAGRDWQGEVVQVMTTEYENGVARKVAQPFRAYRSYGESLEDYARLLAENPRYQAVLKADNAADAARQLQAAGYATDPAYADKLIAVMSGLSQGSAARTEPHKFIASAR